MADAILDLNVPVSISILSELGMYPPEIQKELLKRMTVELTEEDKPLSNNKFSSYLEGTINRSIGGQYVSCCSALATSLGDRLTTHSLTALREFHGFLLSRPYRLDEMLPNVISAMQLIHAKGEEMKKLYGLKMEPSEFAREFFKGGIEYFFSHMEARIQFAPIVKTFLEIYANVPIDAEAKQAFIERARKLGLKEIVELLESHPS